MIVKLVKFFIKEISELRIKKIITEVPLYCIASFIIGAYTVLLISYFCFDNHITPPGVSAFVASMALLFTIYAAFKVKEWSENKKNEMAFQQTVKTIEAIITAKTIKLKLTLPLTRISRFKINNNEELLYQYIKDASDVSLELYSIIAELSSHIETANIWGFDISKEMRPIFKEIIQNIMDIHVQISSMYYIRPLSEVELQKKAQRAFDSSQACDDAVDLLIHFKHSEIFTFE